MNFIELLGRPEDHWRDRAACKGKSPSIWHAWATGSPGKTATAPQAIRELSRTAIRTCNACPVRRECLDWAVATGQQDGVWGGLIPHDRRNLVRATA